MPYSIKIHKHNSKGLICGAVAGMVMMGALSGCGSVATLQAPDFLPNDYPQDTAYPQVKKPDGTKDMNSIQSQIYLERERDKSSWSRMSSWDSDEFIGQNPPISEKDEDATSQDESTDNPPSKTPDKNKK